MDVKGDDIGEEEGRWVKDVEKKMRRWRIEWERRGISEEMVREKWRRAIIC